MSSKRRPKGTGSVRKRRDRHQATYSFIDAAGSRRRRSRMFATRTAAREWLTTRIAEVGAGHVADSQGLTVGDYLTSWVEALSGQVEQKTASWYAWTTRRHLIPALGRLRLERITALDVDRLLAQKAADGTGPTTLRAIRVALGKAMGDAVRKGLVAQNPVGMADRLRTPRTDATLTVWTPDDIGRSSRS